MGWFSKRQVPKEEEVPNAEEFLRMFNEGVSAFHDGKLQRSKDLLLQALRVINHKLTNKSGEAFLYLGLVELKTFDETKNPHDLSNAEGYLLTARTIACMQPEHKEFVIYNLGACYVHQGRYGEAEKCFLEYVEIKPDAKGFIKLGLICYKTGRTREAIKYCERALEIEPTNADALYNLKGLQGLDR
jgi:tetratricopeptide (TPR) repeat protein